MKQKELKKHDFYEHQRSWTFVSLSGSSNCIKINNSGYIHFKHRNTHTGLCSYQCEDIVLCPHFIPSFWIQTGSHCIRTGLDKVSGFFFFFSKIGLPPVLQTSAHKHTESSIQLLTLAAASLSADTNTDAAEEDEQQKTCSSRYQNHHIQRIYVKKKENICPVEQSVTCTQNWALAIKPLTIYNFQLLGHTALGRPHTVGGLAAIHPCICFGHAF